MLAEVMVWSHQEEKGEQDLSQVGAWGDSHG